jgi:N-acylglucosamine 2-epimerase
LLSTIQRCDQSKYKKMTQERTPQDFLALIKKELRDYVVPFWLKYSLDKEYGGYFNNLDRDGKVFDTKKHIWLQGRQVWMLSKLYNSGIPEFHTTEILEAAKLGAEFLVKHAKEPNNNRVYFTLTREGKPSYLQRKIFSECFYSMALSEYSRASGQHSYMDEALEVFQSILSWVHKDHLPQGRPRYDHGDSTTKISELNVPMILLNLIEELRDTSNMTKYNPHLFESEAEWCLSEIKLHVNSEKKMVFETVRADGQLLLESPEGRLLNPGHAIEAGWFLLSFLEHNPKIKDHAQLTEMATNMINWSYDIGWDKEYGGGLLYFIDSEGYSPLQLEWDMKLWWTHNESMIAFAKLYQITGDEKYWKKFVQVTTYSFDHFSDHEYGEWYGYLSRDGKVSQRFKGGPYKGCFHVPRSLLLCEQILQEIMNKNN